MSEAEQRPMTMSDLKQLLQDHRPVSKPAPLMRIDTGPVSQGGRYIPTMSLDPGVITLGIDGYEEHAGYVRCAVEAFAEVHGGLKKLSDAREAAKKNGAWTEANQILIVAKEADILQTRMTRKMDAARQNLLDGIKFIDESLSKPMATAADNVTSAEVRKYVHDLPQDKRHGFMLDALKNNDGKTLAAILGAQPFLSGLTREQQAYFTREFHEQRSPELAKRLAVMRKALSLVESRSALVFGEIERAIGAGWDTVQKLRQTHSEAEKALLLINNAVK